LEDWFGMVICRKYYTSSKFDMDRFINGLTQVGFVLFSSVLEIQQQAFNSMIRRKAE
jgi:hypothetical protein